MKRFYFVLLLAGVLSVSCVENPDIGKEDPPVVDPTLSVSYALRGSYSVELVCSIGQTDRVFIGGGFLYSTTPGFENSQTAPGMVIANELSCTVADLEPDSHYYVRAYVYDVLGRLESDTVTFDSPSFNLQSDSNFHLTYQGGVVDLTVLANEQFQVYCDADWIAGQDTRSGEPFSRSLTVLPNESLYARSAILTLSSPDSYFRETVLVFQDGAPVVIPDSELKAFLVSTYDADGSAEIELAEIPAVTEIVLQSDNVKSLDGIELFPNLEKLVCKGVATGQLSAIDLKGNPLLTYLDVSHNALETLDLSLCPLLKTLDCSRNALSVLDLSDEDQLEYLDCSWNTLETLDLSDNHSLGAIHCDGNRLASLKTPRSETLAELTLKENVLETLDLSNNRGIVRLDCSENHLLALDVAVNRNLSFLDCSSNGLKELSVWRNAALESLLCASNALTSIDLSKNTLLKTLDCHDNLLSTLDLSGNPALESLWCGGNLFPYLDVSMLPSLKGLSCNCEDMDYVMMSRSHQIEGVTVNRSENNIDPATEIRYREDIASIADPSFLSYLIQYYDSDGDGLLSRLEADKVASVRINTDQVETLQGIEYLSGLKYLQCEGSYDGLGHSLGKLTSLDLSHNKKLEQVLCRWNQIASIDVSGCLNLKTLWCSWNKLETLDVSACLDLVDLNCEHNFLESLLLEGNTKLVSLDCSPMSGNYGDNLLKEVRIGQIRIDYINGSSHRRNSCCIPPRTTLYVGGAAAHPLTVPFMFNYNAKDFNVADNTFVNTEGAQWGNDMVLNGSGYWYNDSFVHINKGTYATFKFPSTGDNPFNRRGHDELTIIAKVKGESPNDFSIFACRSESSGYCYMFREGGASTNYFYLHDTRAYGSATSITVGSLPNIVAARAENGMVRLYSFTDNTEGAAQSISWGSHSDSISLFSGGISGEFWVGDFYWIFLSLNALTEDEIEAVIDYNEF